MMGGKEEGKGKTLSKKQYALVLLHYCYTANTRKNKVKKIMKKLLKGLARITLISSILIAFLIPILTLFSPYLIDLITKQLALPKLSHSSLFFLTPLLSLGLGISLWYALESFVDSFLR